MPCRLQEDHMITAEAIQHPWCQLYAVSSFSAHAALTLLLYVNTMPQHAALSSHDIVHY